MKEKNYEESQEFCTSIVAKAWEDESFKQNLISNPKETIESTFKVKLGLRDDQELVVEDQTNTDIIYLNIPAEPNIDEMELTDEELETVSGGSTFVCAGIGGFMLGVKVYEYLTN